MEKTFAGIEVTTIHSTDAGVGMVVEVDGVTIFHPGDHANGKIGLMEEFTDEIDFLAAKGIRPDICFMGIRGCSLGAPDEVKEGIYYTLETLNPRVFIPMHASAQGHVYREFIARLVLATKTRCLAINYRLAPEHPFPAALEDAATAYHWLLAQGFDPSQIIIAGDSAGGGLTLGTLLALRDDGEQLPAGGICISPWTDLALTGASAQNKATVDPILDSASLQMYARYYAGENELTNPLISPLYANPKGLPPLLIQVGTDEILLDDSTRFTEKARHAEVDVILEIWNEMFHVFQLIPFLPETKKMVGSIAEFVSQNIKSHHERADD